MPIVEQFLRLLPLLLALLLPGLAVVFTWLHYSRARAGRLPMFRPLPGLADLQRRLGQAVELGRPVHIGIGSTQAPLLGPSGETMAALLLAQRLTESTTRRGGSVAVTTGDIAAHAAARGLVRQAYEATGFAGDYPTDDLLLVAQQTPVAYAAGVAARTHSQPFEASILAGDYGAEALLITADSPALLPQVAAATNLSALPVLTLSTAATLVGEELWAAEAYVAGTPLPQARLMTQDALRRTVLVILMLGMLYQLAVALFQLNLPSLDQIVSF